MFLAFSPDSAMLASADGDTAIRIYDSRTGTLRSTASDLLLESLALDFSSDSKSLFVGGPDQTISVVDSLTGKIRDTLPKQSGTLRGLVASGDASKSPLSTTCPNASMMPASASCCFGTSAHAPCAQDSSNRA
jgi:WD40 repeat protein